MKNIKFKISNFNKYLVLLISLLFLYLFYLSIPSLYDKGRLQKDLSNKLKNEFKINFSNSSEITYLILPSPHFLIKDAKIYNDNIDNPKELVQIKDLKIFIFQKSFFNQANLEIKKLILNHANFLIKRSDFSFFNNLINKKFSNKKIIVQNSNIFYKDRDDDTVSIFKVLDLDMFFNKKKLINQISSKGKVFKIPYVFNWNKNFENGIKNKTIIELNKLNLKMKNESTTEEKKYLGKNQTIISGLKLIFSYEIENDLITLKSNNSEFLNYNVEYNGTIKVKPFDLRLNINSKKFNFNKFKIIGNYVEEFLKTNLLFNKNLNGTISINLDKILNNKLFDSSKIFMNFNNGEINFNTSQLINSKFGKLNLITSKIFRENSDLLFTGSFNFIIDNKLKFYKTFQVPKNLRKKINNIYFDIEFNAFNDEIKILNVKLDDLNNEKNINFLNYYNADKNNKINSWIDLKIFVNKIFMNYSG
jgi:hypothetical protein